MPLVAVTVQLYETPLVNPDTVIGLLVPVAVWPPQSTVYPVIMEPPSCAGAVNATVREPFPDVAVPMVGASGGVAYVRGVGFDSEPPLDPVSVTGPVAVGVMVKV
jgi:hypothetical protein